MADIKYTPGFKHEDWIDNEDVVQASGDKGFNKKFHDLEGEFKAIATTVATVDTEIKKIQRLSFVTTQQTTLAPGASSAEFPVETYNRAPLPTNVERVYFPVIFPISGPKNIQHTFLYQTVGTNVAVSVQFTNPGSTQATFNWRVIGLAT